VSASPVRIAAIADLHIRTNQDLSPLRRALRGIQNDADVMLIAGDLTEMGRMVEMEQLAEVLKQVSIPVFAILGNHDRRNVRRTAQIRILRDIGVRVLDASGAVVKLPGDRTLAIAGSTGTGGGFRPGSEEFGGGVRFTRAVMMKSRRESARLRKVLKHLCQQDPDLLVVMTHFTPTPSTLGSEPPLKYWMLGNALLGTTIDEFAPTLVVHGHAHLGNEVGSTEAGVPVRNVALQVTQGIRLLSLLADGTVESTGLRPIAGMEHETSLRESDVR
jgi:Icc-related predicted phosphoesterase